MASRILIPSLVAGLTFFAAGAESAAPAKQATPQPAPAIVSSDRLIDQGTAVMKAVLATGVKEGILRKSDAKAIAEYYAAQAYVPSWTADGTLTDRALLVVDRIAHAELEGLDPAAYPMPLPNLGVHRAATPTELATADVMLSQAIASYGADAYAGRLVPESVSENFGYDILRPDPISVLGLVATSDNPAETLYTYHPPQKEFALLRTKLAELRGATEAEKKPEIPEGDLLKPGMGDPRVIMIRERLNVATDVPAPDVYGEAVVEAVKAFQKASRLRADGIVGNATLAVFNKGEPDLIPLVLANMERWRWMPRYLGNFYVRVNVPNFNVEIYKDDAAIHETRIVVGKPTNQTPVFSNNIQFVVINPVWNVPASIALKEMLPTIRKNGGRIRGYQVYAKVKGRFRAVDPRMINWNTVNMRNIQIKQPPGERNALGSIKFMFPNKYAVYLHDTPSKSLFERDYRAFSHGCMRVMDPWAFADVLLSQDPGWDSKRFRKLVGGPERRVDLPHQIPVHITYFTAWVDANGALQIRDDVYGHDARTLKGLESQGNA